MPAWTVALEPAFWSRKANGLPLVLVYLAGLAAMLWVLNLTKRSFWLCALLALPGTLCHELCHWLVGKLLNAQPVHFTVLPRREGHGFVLGAVAFRNLRWYSAFFVGMAPLLLLPLAYLLLLWRLGGQPVLDWSEAVILFLLANLVFAALPSWQDVRIAVRSPVGWLLLAGALVWGWLHFTQSTPALALPTRARTPRGARAEAPARGGARGGT